MGEVINHKIEGSEGSAELVAFDSLAAFSEAVEAATGVAFDLASVTELTTDFVQVSDSYLLLNVKEYGVEAPDNLLFLTEDKNYVFSRKPPSLEGVKGFEDVFPKLFGRSTVFVFVTLDKVLESYKRGLEGLLSLLKKLEDSFDSTEYRQLGLEFERFSDRLEEFNELLLRLQARRCKQVETQYISFDYNILISEASALQRRCRRRLSTLQALRQDYEMRATEELNKRMVKLNDVVKRLTALTVILMIPTLIASHFGMNFIHMPELSTAWAYPAVIIFQVVFIAIGFFIFRKIGWL
jgi:hypothetical protein